MTKSKRKKIIVSIISLLLIGGIAGTVIYFATRDKNSDITPTGNNTNWEEKYDFENGTDQYNTYEDHTLPPLTLE